MVLYPLLRKVETGLGSDAVPRECTPVEITSWVAEAGILCGDMRITGRNGGKPVREAND